VGVDARAPKFDGGIVTRVDSIPYGIVVNERAERFYDEGEDLWPKRYANWGGLVAAQPNQIAYSIFDAKAWGRFIPTAWPPYEAQTIEDLARVVGLGPEALRRTVAAYNRSASSEHEFQMASRDHRQTRDLNPPKSNWALRIDRPPYYAYPLRPGITFTYFGVAVDESARVVATSGAPYPNVFAAGEVMAGNILRRGYLGGFGMTIGTVFGRLAGTGAARVR
jgi:tricarballylate dehydrogenase